MYTNVINSAFDNVSTVEAACDLLLNFYVLAKRERVVTFVQKKSSNV